MYTTVACSVRLSRGHCHAIMCGQSWISKLRLWPCMQMEFTLIDIFLPIFYYTRFRNIYDLFRNTVPHLWYIYIKLRINPRNAKELICYSVFKEISFWLIPKVKTAQLFSKKNFEKSTSIEDIFAGWSVQRTKSYMSYNLPCIEKYIQREKAHCSDCTRTLCTFTISIKRIWYMCCAQK